MSGLPGLDADVVHARTAAVGGTFRLWKLREKGAEMDLVTATGLSLDELRILQRGVATLRDNLRAHVHQERPA